MAYERENEQAIIDYFRSGAKGCVRCDGIGVEVEHFVVRDDGTAVPYEVAEGVGVREVLDHLGSFYPERIEGEGGELIGLSSPQASITLEPAAQIEISIAPFARVADVVEVYRSFRRRVDPFLHEQGYRLVTEGYHPRERALDLPLIPKRRYRFMDDYFRSLGTHGERMMRGSASTQVSVDYADEADAVRKMRVAQALAVVFASLTDNVSSFEAGRPEPLSHIALWRDVDDARCGCVPGLFGKGFGFASYAKWLLGVCPIFVTRPSLADPQGPALRGVAGLDAAQAYGDALMGTADIEHLLSMVWPDVRLKRFVEIRPADALPERFMAAYAALIKGLFSSGETLSRIEDAFGVVGGVWPLDDHTTDRAIAEVREKGDGALYCGHPLTWWRAFVLSEAARSLPADEASLLAALDRA